MGLAPAQLDLVRTAALLHDLGKLAVPDRILRKPGALTANERRIVATHAPQGAAVLGILPSLCRAAAVVRYHHHHFDGAHWAGRRLRGDQLPLASRILAVADAYEAMTSDRVYRRALSPAAARGELLAQCGRQFDPAIVRAFLNRVPAPS